jgi:hypothetical protein
MPNISLTLYTNIFFSSILMSPIQMGSLSVNNSVTNILRLGTFNSCLYLRIWSNFHSLKLCLHEEFSSRYYLNFECTVESNHAGGFFICGQTP